MKATDLHIGSSVYRATCDAIEEGHVIGVELKDESIDITVKTWYGCRCGRAHRDDECVLTEYNAKWYFNLESAEIDQLHQREAAVKQAYSDMVQCQEHYQSLIAKYMFAEPSKPTCRESK